MTNKQELQCANVCCLYANGPNVVFMSYAKVKCAGQMTNKQKTSVCQCVLPLNGPYVVFMSFAKVKCAGQMTNKQNLQCANAYCL